MMRLCLLFLAPLLAYAQFFPLQPGNQWIYRVDDGPVRDVRVAEISGVEKFDDVEYFLYRDMFGEQTPIRLNKENQLVQRNADGSESLWADFGAAEGATFPTAFDRCTGRGRIETRDAFADILNRVWIGGIRVAYAATTCADAGVTSDLYLPGLGLAERTYNTFTGPRRYKLTYARIGNASVIASGEYGFRLSLDQRQYPSRARIGVRMTLENWATDPIKLTFNSGQNFDYSIRDENGAVITEMSVSGEKNWTAADEVELRPGNYTLETWLTSARPPQFRAQVPFTVVKE
jgi:Intracellular proteinase inhibitor